MAADIPDGDTATAAAVGMTGVTADLPSDARSGLSSRPGPQLDIARGEFIDRYVVLEQIGAGGMGVVFKALDPELERRVAIKLLRPTGDSESTEGRARLVREGQAIAQLSHPNVVAVHDIGVFRDGLFFVAMEYVEGKSLKAWLREEHSREEMVALFAQAGKGLAAAHAKGLIHRDFKPDNVLVGDDGRVRVADFGLARAETAATVGDSPEYVLGGSRSSNSTGSLRSSLTRTGDIMGTPAYMAPEQCRGEVGDARTDQFSFCVTLYEALCGRRPFKTGSCAWGVDGKPEPVRPIPQEADLPGWLQRLVLRGLSADPNERYCSMDALLEELTRDRGLKAGRAFVIGSLVIFAAIAAAVLVPAMVAPQERKCRGAAAKVSAVWNPETRASVGHSFRKTGRPYAEEAFTKVAAAFESYGVRWTEMYVEACEATAVHGVQSAHLLDLRMACLDRRLSEVGALSELLSGELTASQMDNAVGAVYTLPDLAICANRELLEAVVPPPTDPAVRGRVQGLRRRLDQAGSLEATGEIEAGLSIAKAVAEETLELGYDPVRAEALFTLGRLQRRAGDPTAGVSTYYEALEAAARARDRALVTSILAELVVVVGYMQGKYEAGYAFYRAAVTNAGFSAADWMTQFHMHKNLGVVLNNQGRYDEALLHHQQAYDLAARELPADHPYLSMALNNLGTVYAMQGETDKALGFFRQALALGERAMGDTHPDLNYYLSNIGQMLSDQEKYDDARPYLARAVAIAEGALGKDHPDLSYPLLNLARAYAEQGNCQEAIKVYARAERVWAVYGDGQPDTAYTLVGTGRCLTDLGRGDEARAPLERAVKLLTSADADPNVLALAQFQLARALWSSGGDRGRAVELAVAAQSAWAAPESGNWKKARKQAQAWLAERGR